ncbi:MAG: NADH-quinone oxidoreductase subunit N [Gemmatimonadaceae bacterium]|nr:NADH-quinone oxidoreductase subunit N [Gemmatimonadaceae bacterium]
MDALVNPGSLLQALAPELLMIAGAMVLLLATVWRPQGNERGSAEGAERTGVIARFSTLLCVVVSVVVIIMWGDAAPGTPDLRIAGDGFRWAIDLIILAGTGLSLTLLEGDHERSGAFSPETPILMVLGAAGMMVLAAARDLMFIFLGIELMSLAVYVLAGVNRRSARGAEAAIKYFLLGAFSTGFLLYGMALVFGATGSTRLVDINTWVMAHAALSPMLRVGLGLLLAGFAFKLALAPFHFWTPDVYDGAPLPVTAFMSAVVKTAAFAAFARVMTEALPGAVAAWHPVLWWLSVLTMIVGNMLALSQRNLVRLLAYSSIAHAGYLLVAIVVSSNTGTAALVFYAVSYTLATMGAFGVLITVNGGRDRSPTIEDLAGLWLVRPGLAIAMAVFLLAFLGMPLAGGMGFFAKWYLLQSALQASMPQTVLAVVLALSSAVAAAYYLAVIAAMFMRRRPDGQAVPSGAPLVGVLIAGSAVALLVLGVYPTPMARLARRAIPSHTVQPPRPDSVRSPAVPLTTATLAR